MTGIAVKVTELPEHIVLALAEMLILGVPTTLTFTMIAFDVATGLLTQVEFEVSTQVTICPLVRLLDVKEALLLPTFTPFTFH